MSHASLIAVVDDDDAIREALDDLIRSLGHRCVPFASAEAFLAFADRDVIACLVLDVQMPGLNGLELQERLNTEGSALPVLFMTSYVDDAVKAKALGGGARRVLGKPVDAEILVGCLEAVLRTG